MKAIFIFIIISLVINPILGFILLRIHRESRRLRILFSIGSLLIISVLVLAKINQVSFKAETINVIFFSISYLGLCYLIWNLIYLKNRILKIVGICFSAIVFGFGLIMGYARFTNLNEPEIDIVCKKNINEYEGTVHHYVGFDGKWDIHQIQLYKQKGPFEKLIFNKRYINEIPLTYSSVDLNFNKKNHELELTVYDTLKNKNIIVWQDVINESNAQ